MHNLPDDLGAGFTAPSIAESVERGTMEKLKPAKKFELAAILVRRMRSSL